MELYGRQFLNDGIIRNDDIATGGSFLTRMLRQTMPKIYEIKYAPLWALQGEYAVPVAGNLAGYANTVEELVYESGGEAREYVDMTSDIPTVNSAMTSSQFNVHKFAAATEYSLEELASFEVQPQKLSKDLQNIDRVLRQSAHELIVFGNAKRNSTGLFNDPNVPTDTGYNPATATWQDHINFFAEQITAIEDRNFLSGAVGRIHLTNRHYQILATTRQTNDAGRSALQAIREDYPSVNFVKTNEVRSNILEQFGAKAPGTNEDLVVFLPVLDDNQIDRLADAPSRMPSQWRDMTYRTVFFIRSSQTIIHQPEQMTYYSVPSLY